MGVPRSESRASNLSVELSGSEHLHQARQMMSRPGSADPHAASNGYQGELYRTESPAPFAPHLSSGPSQVTDSPGTFVMDLPSTSYQHPSHLHAATVPAQFGMDEQFGMHGMHGSNGGYYPHHVSTI
jgi:hypothetical protein